MFNLDEIIQVMADAYYAAAAKNAKMRSAAETLETIRAAMIQEPDIFNIWYAFNEQIGRAESERLQPALISLRSWFEEKVCANEIARLHEIFHQDSEAGWKEWLRTYTEALSYWRVNTLCTALVKERFRFPYSENQNVEMIKRATKCVLHERWMEAYGLFLYLAGLDFIPNAQRAKLLVTAGEIQLYHFVKPDKARELFESAQNLAPDECRAICGIGEYWLNNNDFEKAEEYFRRAVNISSNSSDGYVYMGDSLKKKGKIDEAEEWYQKGIRTRDAGSSEYLRLISLYSSPELFNKNRDRLPLIVQRAIAVDPSGRYAAYMGIGYCYQQNKEYEETHRCYTKAIELDNTRLEGYTALGHTYIDEKKYDLARTNFLKVIEKAPDAHDGYWGMAQLCEREIEEKDEEGKKKLWEETLDWYEQCIKRRPEWEVPIRSNKADIGRKLHQLDIAEEELFKGLRSEPENQNLLYSLHSLADDYKREEKMDAALHILKTIREIRGEAYEAEYHNNVGNVKYYFSDYRAAADSYLKAISANPRDAIYHSNLALVWENLKVPGNRIEELENAIKALSKALELEPENKEYADRLKSLELKKKLVVTYGEPALSLMPFETPIAVEFSNDLLPYILSEGTKNLSIDFTGRINAMRGRIRERFGVNIPGVRCRGGYQSTDISNYVFFLMGIPIASGNTVLDKKFFPGRLEDLTALEIAGEEALNSPTGIAGYWIAQKDWGKAKNGGLVLWEVDDYILRHLEAVLQKNLVEFVDHQEVMSILGYGETYDNIKNSPERLTALTEILKRLVREEVPITSLNAICNKFTSLLAVGIDAMNIVERLRSLPEILPSLPGNNDQYSFYQLSKSFEVTIDEFISEENILSMEPEIAHDFLRAVRDKVGSEKYVAILVEKAKLRPFIKRLIEYEFPNIPILSRQELLPGLEGKVKGVIDLAI